MELQELQELIAIYSDVSKKADLAYNQYREMGYTHDIALDVYNNVYMENIGNYLPGFPLASSLRMFLKECKERGYYQGELPSINTKICQ